MCGASEQLKDCTTGMTFARQQLVESTKMPHSKVQWRKIEEKVGGGSAPTNSGPLLADAICRASLRVGPGRARQPNEFLEHFYLRDA